jgi:hypothetical protein
MEQLFFFLRERATKRLSGNRLLTLLAQIDRFLSRQKQRQSLEVILTDSSCQTADHVADDPIHFPNVLHY